MGIKFTADDFIMMIDTAMMAPPPMQMGVPPAGTSVVGNPSMGGMGGNPMIQQLIEKARMMRQGGMPQ
jgi:hypothetical protein